MLTKHEIQHIPVNLEIVKEGVSQAEKRLIDALDTRKNLEQKSFTLLSGYVTVSIALFGLAANLGRDNTMFSTLLLIGCIFFGGVIALVLSLRSSDYGTLGRYPDTWLQQGTLEGDNSTLAVVMAYILHDYDHRIRVSDKSNKKKAAMLNVGILLGVSTPALLLSAILLKFLS